VSGARLGVGFLVMGVFVPLTLFLFLGFDSINAFLILAVTTFCGWCLADVMANILSRPRLKDRTPSDALHNWEGRRVKGEE
jgi:hypothetical protein